MRRGSVNFLARPNREAIEYFVSKQPAGYDPRSGLLNLAHNSQNPEVMEILNKMGFGSGEEFMKWYQYEGKHLLNIIYNDRLKMSNRPTESFIDRLGRILKEADSTGPIIVNTRDQAEAMAALHNSRGPAVGWLDYVAGRDYQPPYKWDTADVASVHSQSKGTKKVNISSPAIPIGPKDTKGNPHSSKYGGVRPWSPDEILRTLMTNTDDSASQGVLWKIAHKGAVRRAFDATGRNFNPEEAVALGASAVFRSLFKDQARPGTKFTSYVGLAVQEAMTSGVPAGFGDEYRKARGILSSVEVLAKRAAKKVATGTPADAEIAELQNIASSIDPEPDPSNELGMLPPRILKCINAVIDTCSNGDAEGAASAASFVASTKEEITDEESMYRERGPSTDTLITKSKEQAPLGTTTLTMTSPSGKEVERPMSRNTSRIHDDPRIKDVLSKVVRMIRTGRGSGKGWVADLTRTAIAQLKDLVSRIGSDSSSREYTINVDKEGYNVIDASTNTVVGQHDYEQDARHQLQELQQDPVLARIRSLVDNFTRRTFGDYAEELLDSGNRIVNAVKTDNLHELDEIIQELDELDVVASEDQQIGQRDVSTKPITQQAYRILLRLYGIDDYPERGTVDDPEILEDGSLSNWARSGYPPIDDNKAIAADLGISATRVSQHKSKLETLLPELIRQIQQDLYENKEFIDFNLLTELRIALGFKLIYESSRNIKTLLG